MGTLANPHLRNVLGINGRERRVQGPLVQVPVDGRRKEDDGRSLAGGHLQVHDRKFRLSALDAIVEVYQNGHDPLATVLGKSPSVFVAQIECVKVLWVPKQIFKKNEIEKKCIRMGCLV
jgi:hypothetical protein